MFVVALVIKSSISDIDEAECSNRYLSFHPNPPVRSQLCVNTTDPCNVLEPGIKYCKKGSTGLWRLVRCENGYELHVIKIKKSHSPYEMAPNETLSYYSDDQHNQEYYWGSCHDIDECERGEEVHSCSHLCQNTMGAFRCRCPVGFALARDARTCLSIAKNLVSLVGMFFEQSVDYISDHKL